MASFKIFFWILMVLLIAQLESSILANPDLVDDDIMYRSDNCTGPYATCEFEQYERRGDENVIFRRHRYCICPSDTVCRYSSTNMGLRMNTHRCYPINSTDIPEWLNG